MFESCGTPSYIAPEILNKKGYGKEIDIWSAGCIFYQMVCGENPFQSSSRNITLSKIQHEDPDFDRFEFFQYSSAARELMIQMLNKSPKQRITIEDALDHQFFRK